MMVPEDEWLHSAMSDDLMVANLLLRLKQPSSLSLSSSLSPSVAKTLLPPPRWGIRLPRSRMAFRCDAASSSPGEKPDLARNSPTTPLAWSAGGGAASSSGTANGSDESNLKVFCSSDSRSKVVSADDPAKKSKRKKTFSELKEEEDSLLKERVHLKKEIATLRTTFKEHTATNENLKRMQLDFDLSAKNGSTMAADGKEGTASALEKETLMIHRTTPIAQDVCPTMHSSSLPVEEPGGGFLLPDLNLTPSEDDFALEGFHGGLHGVVGSMDTIQVRPSYS